ERDGDFVSGVEAQIESQLRLNRGNGASEVLAWIACFQNREIRVIEVHGTTGTHRNLGAQEAWRRENGKEYERNGLNGDHAHPLQSVLYCTTTSAERNSPFTSAFDAVSRVVLKQSPFQNLRSSKLGYLNRVRLSAPENVAEAANRLGIFGLPARVLKF